MAPLSKVVFSTSTSSSSTKTTSLFHLVVKKVMAISATYLLESTLLTSFLSVSHFLFTRVENLSWVMGSMILSWVACIAIYANRMHFFDLTHSDKTHMNNLVLLIQVLSMGYFIWQIFSKGQPSNHLPSSSSSFSSSSSSTTALKSDSSSPNMTKNAHIFFFFRNFLKSLENIASATKTFFLEPNNYTLQKALSWGLCDAHIRKVQGYAKPFFHGVIAALEFPPFLGQIISLFELGIYYLLNLFTKDFSHSMARKRTLEKPLIIKEPPPSLLLERRLPSHKLPKCEKQSENLPYKLTNHPENIIHYAKDVTYYSCYCQGVDDHDFGGGWRTLQMSLSFYLKEKTPTLTELYDSFGSLENLQALYEKKYPTRKFPRGFDFSPQATSLHWAEPFFAEMVMFHYQISSDLFLMNGYSAKKMNTPQSLFHKELLTSENFFNKVIQHFTNGACSPVIIDNGKNSYSILGIGNSDDNNITLWIGNPQIISHGVNRSSTEIGTFTVTLKKTGEQITHSLTSSEQSKFTSDISEIKFFDDQNWMILFPLLHYTFQQE